ncbi:putative bifunctional diguanylate cyclase/phosphodiesterase [Cognatiluteimonas profundi]|uniref:putative bifunctional diguanylate cyclase/phosphodiesterase n=1 Tax=Cognatiluteimonas profundi TaxID=2594501 RepID=UPI00131CB8C8|nr:EAL domain-containing protein [Lysobacter profundi]
MNVTRTPFARGAIRALAFVAGYIACVAYAWQFIASPGDIALYWPASGVALAWVVLRGARWSVLVPVAMWIAHAGFQPGRDALLPYALVSGFAGALAGGWMACRKPVLRPGTVVYGFRILQGGAVMAVVSAIIGGFGMWRVQLVPAPDLMATQLRWALGDLLGIASITPALLLAADWWQRRPHERRDYPGGVGESLLWNIALVGSFLLMAWGMSLSHDFALGLSSLPLAVALWSALRFTPLRTAVSVLLTVALIAGFAGLGLAGFRPAQGTLEVAILLVYLCLLAILPMVLAMTVNEHRAVARSLLRRATTDALSGLPNRGAFETQVRMALRDPANVPLALAYIDLDNLKLVNDTASHQVGDQLVKAVAESLRTQMRSGDVLGHLGGDEFVVLFHNATPTIARERAQRLLHAVDNSRHRVGEEQYGTTASIGLVPFQPEQVEFAEVLSQADAACFNAKELGGDRVSMAGAMAGSASDPTSGMRWTVRIREALKQQGFLLYAQSIAPLHASMDDGAHFELLLRMRDSRGGTPHLPDRFIPAAERFQLAVKIDREVVRLALERLEAFPEAATAVSLCAINLSAAAMMDEGFVGFVAERLHRSSFPANRLCFEITETSAMRDPARAQRVIDDLRSLGCRFALDDFGTGFCSFGHLRALDVDFIKIDGSFVRDMETSPLAAEVVSSITRIAHLLNKRTIAEHTETESVRSALSALGVDYAQGFAIDRPQPFDAYLAAIAEVRASVD